MRKSLIAGILWICGSLAQAREENLKILKVGTDPDFPPYEYYQEASGAYTGFDVDLIRDLAVKMGYDGVKFQKMEFSELLERLNAGEFDVAIAGLTVTPERAQNISFSRSYITDGFKVIVRRDSSMSRGLMDLSGKTVAAEQSSSALAVVQEFGRSAKVLETFGTEEALRLVRDGKADCAVASKLAASFFLANGWGGELSFAGSGVIRQDKVAMAVGRNNRNLLKQLNNALEQYLRSSAYDQLYRTYFGTFK